MADEFKDRFEKMSDEELLEIAASGDDMMPEAQGALDAELDGRNLRGELAVRLAPSEMPAKHAPILMFPDPTPSSFSVLQWEPEFVDPMLVPALPDEEGRDLVLISFQRNWLRVRCNPQELTQSCSTRTWFVSIGWSRTRSVAFEWSSIELKRQQQWKSFDPLRPTRSIST
jgi:hypothetical protein